MPDPDNVRRPWYEAASPLLRDLIKVRNSRYGVDSLASQPALLSELEIRAHLVVPDLNPERQHEWVEKLLEKAVSSLRNVRHQQAAKEVFGLGILRGLGTRARRERAAAAYDDMPYNTFRAGQEQILFELLATTIERLVEDSVDVSVLRPMKRRPYWLKGAYASRGLLESNFGEMAMDTRFVALVGDRGTGKSRLAWELAAAMSRPPRKMVWIDASTERSFDQDVFDALDEFHDVVAPDPVARRRAFWKLLGQASGPAIVVLDDVQDLDSLRGLDSIEPHSLILVTASRRHIERLGFRLVDVGNLSVGEAFDMIRKRLVSAPDKDVLRLAKTSDCRPLAIETLCALINEDGLHLQELCEIVDNQVAKIFNIPAEEGQATIAAVYVSAINSIARASGPALHLLALMTFAHVEHGVPPGFLARCLARVCEIPDDPAPLRRAYYTRSVAILRDRCLVDFQRGGVTMHTLTQAVLRGVLGHVEAGVRSIVETVATADGEAFRRAQTAGEMSTLELVRGLNGMMQSSHYPGSPFMVSVPLPDSGGLSWSVDQP